MTDARARFDRPIFRRLRELCLALPETRETRSWGHPNFRVGTKTFCTLEVVQRRPSIAFRVPPADVTRLKRKKHFFLPHRTDVVSGSAAGSMRRSSGERWLR